MDTKILRKTLKKHSKDCDASLEGISIISKLFVYLIRGYQRALSPIIAANCIFTPSCSQYAIDAYKKYGFFKATLMMFWRIIRCNPWSKGGDDPA